MVLARPQIAGSIQYLWPSCAHRQQIYRIASARSLSQRFLKRTAEAAYEWCQQAGRIRAGKKQSILSILEERGYVHSVVGSRDDLDRLMIDKRIGAYVGIDPTGPSLHIGHLVPLMALFWMHINGFHTVTLLGGTTAKVGDPSGRSTSREDRPSSIRKANMASMHLQLKKLWDRVEKHAKQRGYEPEWAWRRELVNNNMWLQNLKMTDVLYFLGSGVRIGPMLGRDAARERMTSKQGMSLGEFLYPVLQSWDWWQLYDKRGIQVQIGGSDQYGNILAGIDAIKHINQRDDGPFSSGEKGDFLRLSTPMGLTVPLLKSASGEKFGKSLGNAIWLDSDMTSIFELYQYFLRTSDEDVGRYLKLFTFMPIAEIEKVVEDHKMQPSKRLAQHTLAYEVVTFLQGEQRAKEAREQHDKVFRIPLATKPVASERLDSAGPSNPNFSRLLNPRSPPITSSNAPSPNLILPRSLVYDQPIARLLYHAGLVSSKSEGHRLAMKRGAYIASIPGQKKPMGDQLEFTPALNWDPSETEKFVIDGDTVILRVGKWNVKIIKIVSDEEFEKRGLTAPGWKEEEIPMKISLNR